MKVEIKEPCSENWDKMKIGLVSRHCDSCEKNVMDFTKMNRGEIIMHLLNNPNDQVCGRMRKDQFEFRHEDIPILVEALRIQRPSNSFLIIALVCLSLSSCSDAPEGKIKTPPAINDKIEHIDNNTDSYHDTTTTGELEIVEPKVVHSKTGGVVISEPVVPVISPEPVGMVTMGLPYIITDPDIDPPMPGPEPHKIISNEPMDFPETMSEYNGGVEAMFAFINTNITYPKYERSNNIQGNVYVKFVVEKDGSITNPVILKSVTGSKNFDAEVIRIINKMPNWKPGEHRGKSVRSNMTLPIRFVLKD
ncbi:MAG: TonB family protein [Crocinitomicaceae bacterium]|jgi:TonB family protein